MEKSTAIHPQLSPENLTNNLAKKLFLKKGELTLSRKPNTHLENHFYHFKIPVWLVIQNTVFQKKKKKK